MTETDPLWRAFRYVKLFDAAKRIVESEASWPTKYNLIFSDEISFAMHDLFPLDYYDPDGDYEQDVRAWFRAAEEKAEDLRKVLETP